MPYLSGAGVAPAALFICPYAQSRRSTLPESGTTRCIVITKDGYIGTATSTHLYSNFFNSNQFIQSIIFPIQVITKKLTLLNFSHSTHQRITTIFYSPHS